MKIGIFLADSNGAYPVPATNGGAVQSLTEKILLENEFNYRADIDMYSFYEPKAFEKSKYFERTYFRWIKVPKFVHFMDRFLFWFFRNFLVKKKSDSFRTLLSLLYYIIYCAFSLKKKTYDLLIFENNVMLAWIVKLSRYKGEYCYHFHNVPRISASCKDVFKKCKKVFCVSNYVALQISSKESAIGQIYYKNIKILHNCIDVERFKPLLNNKEKSEIKKEFGILDRNKVVLFVGRLNAEKGVDKVLKAVIKLNNKNIKLLIVGSYLHNAEFISNYEKELQELATCMKGQVIFTGYIKQERLPAIYGCADVAVLPSMWDEPAGLTMIEAMACGIPVITTKVGGIPEYVQNYAKVLDRDENLVDNIAFELTKILELESIIDYEQVDFVKKNYATGQYLEKLLLDV